MRPVIDLRGVSYVADGTTIIDGVSWCIRRGEHWAVLGPNGSGKTTLLKLACGYLWPNAGGEILRGGQPMVDLRTLRRSIGWVTSMLVAQIPPRECVCDTVVSGRLAQTGLRAIGRDRPSKEDYEQAEVFLEELGCRDLVNRRYGTLSQGEQQMVLIARARMAAPLLLVLDEPCAGLDPGSRERVLASIDQLARRPEAPSLVLVTHHLEEIMPSLGNILVMAGGKVISSGKTDEVIDEPLISQVYGRPLESLVRHGGRFWPIW